MDECNSQKKMLDDINRSGFPFQRRIKHLVNSMRPGTFDGTWRTLFEEHAWQDSATGKVGFIDLILTHKHCNLFLVVECKRLLDTQWVFLYEEDQKSRSTTKIFIYDGDKNIFLWEGVILKPSSALCQYSIPSGIENGEGRKNKPRLEIDTIASDLVLATQSFAEEVVKEKIDVGNQSAVKCFCSMIVTNAKLFLHKNDPEKISLSEGKFEQGERLEEVPYIRYHKQLSTVINPNYQRQGMSIDDAKKRTVFIVNSESLENFLKDFSNNYEITLK